MEYARHFIEGTRKGTSERGEYFAISLMTEMEDGKKYHNDFFVDAEMYEKALSLNRFQEVDAIFLPGFKGRAKLVSIEGL